MIMQYVSHTFTEYCRNNGIHPANCTGSPNQLIAEHVCHDEHSDGYAINDRVRRFEVGRNAWISGVNFNRDLGTVEISVNVNRIDNFPQENDWRMGWRPIDPSRITMYDLQYLDGEIQFVEMGDDLQENLHKLPTKQQRLRRNLLPTIKSRANYHSLKGYTPEEQNALDTLREMISEADFRKYLKYGFVLIKGASGLVYQIHRNKAHTKVWDSGELVEEVCVRIKDPKVPLTDNVIAFMSMILASEEAFKALGNVYNMRKAA
jgi:hypothetical protein